MSQSTDAAERSAHVIRGGSAEAPQGPPLIRLFRDAQGKEVAQLEVVAALQEENARLRAALEMAERHLILAGGGGAPPPSPLGFSPEDPPFQPDTITHG